MNAQNRFICRNLEMLLLPVEGNSSNRLYGFYHFNGKQRLTTTAVAGMSGIIELNLPSALFFISDPQFFYGTAEDLETNQPVHSPTSLHDFSDKTTRMKKHYYILPLSALKLSEPRQILIGSLHQTLCEQFPFHLSHFLLVDVSAADTDPRSRSHRLFLRFPRQVQESAQGKGAVYQYVPESERMHDLSPMYTRLPKKHLQRSLQPLDIFPTLTYR